MSTTSSQPAQSYFEIATGLPVKPLWVIRGIAITVLVDLALAILVWKAGTIHGFCLGIAAGLMIGLVAQTFAKTEVKDACIPIMGSGR